MDIRLTVIAKMPFSEEKGKIMNNGASITDKIKSDAEIVINENISTAKEKADRIIERAEKSAKDELNKLKSELPSLEKEIIDRRVTVANIDAKKLILIKKSEVIDEAFSAAEECIAKDKRYKPWLTALIKENAENGDSVLVGSGDKKLILAKDIEDIAKAKKITLKLSADEANFTHGVILIGATLDKNLTLGGLIKQSRDDLMGAVTEKLFGESNN